MNRRLRNGATALEFALLLPVFLLIVGGTMDIGWIYWQQSALDVAVHDGCRHASLLDPGVGNANMAAILSDAESSISDRMADAGITCDDCPIEATAITIGTEDAIRCEASRPFLSVGGVAHPAEIQSSISMRLELQR